LLRRRENVYDNDERPLDIIKPLIYSARRADVCHIGCYEWRRYTVRFDTAANDSV